MENKKVRVRFAPSPTGGLHLGGVRTVLFNYLFAKQHKGSFIVRIEDTDQTRFVEGAEQYIFDCLQWCGLVPEESPVNGGPFAPYRQSERKEIYKQYALKLVEKGHAYYAFDTPAELEEKRKAIPNFQYNHQTRRQCTNSLTLSPEAVLEKLSNNTPYVIRIKMPEHETVTCHDMIRGTVEFNTSLCDDKVLLKADGMPTYHLAVVVDDYLMQITHAFRGEEWLPSAPVHILLWNYLFGLNKMPQWAHLPLILKPDGNGKLSKRDGERLGFPVFAMDWTDPATGNTTTGFKERGFLPEAFVNMLAMLGWNDGSGQEIFSLQELIEKFSIERIHKGGAKFDYEKAKWFNHSWLQKLPVQQYADKVKPYFENASINITNDAYLYKVMELVKERCQVLPDFVAQSSFFFQHPEQIDTASIAGKWNAAKQQFFAELIRTLELATIWDAENLEKDFKEMAAAHQLKPGELMLPFRIMLVGGKFGPHVFDIAATIGREATIHRIKHTLQLMQA
ncbi:MAG: glutamate--tRNA ligase [Sphingobacteriales bacterium]|uniref:glutamate--tRNA ligase n=1 Tax=Hydrotalea flava TaxID=714549 RepID=UPI000836B341|nr:glutamate--tRNA ligase [Hydrotalea flava]RTL55528.1 MAG: glutamate--tRNA ligase [Sphingobacteriales bacterium]